MKFIIVMSLFSSLLLGQGSIAQNVNSVGHCDFKNSKEHIEIRLDRNGTNNYYAKARSTEGDEIYVSRLFADIQVTIASPSADKVNYFYSPRFRVIQGNSSLAKFSTMIRGDELQCVLRISN